MAVRSQGKIALAVASSRIAALLINSRTAHSRFKIPIDLHKDSACNIPVQSELAEFIRQSTLIVWDEVPMMHRYVFEAVDRTLKDILGNNVPFGGKIFVCGVNLDKFFQ